MPTRRPRHILTETDAVAKALDDAAERWPEDRDRRARLLVRLVEEGRRSLRNQQNEALDTRRAAVRATAGALKGAYEPNYLATLREDWPE